MSGGIANSADIMLMGNLSAKTNWSKIHVKRKENTIKYIKRQNKNETWLKMKLNLELNKIDFIAP